MWNEERYEEFVEMMTTKYPKMFTGQYGGFAVGPGWWHAIEALCGNIQSHIDYRNRQRELLLKDNPYGHKIPDHVEQVVVTQIKEKFGGLRFYYDGGDDTIDGLVRMAESWADSTCEVCGAPGTRRGGGWIKTLCDFHHEENVKAKQQRINHE